MVLTASLSESWRVFFAMDIKEHKLIMPLVVTLKHSVKSVQIRSFFWAVFSCIRTEYRKIQTTKNSIFGHFSRSEIIYGIRKEAILDPLLFNIYISDNNTDDNTPYNFDFSLENVICNLKKSTNSLSNWFRENHMKANADKCHLLVSFDETYTAKIENFRIKNSAEEKLLGVKS